MAKRLKSNNADTVLTNQLSDRERVEKLAEATAAQIALDREKTSFNAKLLQRSNEEVMPIVRDLLGMTTASFKHHVRGQKLKDNAEKDEESWTAFQDHCRLSMAALRIGDQLDMLEVADRAAKGKGKKPAKGKAAPAKSAKKNGGAPTPETFEEDDTNDTLKEARTKGISAGADGKSLDTNPYLVGSKHHQAFAAGWNTSQAALRRTLGRGQEAAAKH